MRALVQRVARASVRVNGEEVASIGPGLLIFLGVKRGETQAAPEWMAERCAGLRIFEDGAGKMNRSVVETGGEVLIVSQFTLYADTTRGRRPGFESAAQAGEAEPAYRRFCDAFASHGVPTQSGQFGGTMEVDLTNLGPATFMMESPGG